MSAEIILRDIVELQTEYQHLIEQRNLTKKNICDLVIPFRDKYELTDTQALKVARSEISLKEILEIIKKNNKKGELIMTKKLYIVGPLNGREGTYLLLTEDGECLASHVCSHRGYAIGDLIQGRPERQKEYKERFGEYTVLYLGDDDMTEDELHKRNQAWAEKKFGDEAVVTSLA